ncbi:MAG TPA: ferritin [Bacteroidales bacterium]|nr:ferritin [Bacteroidales bacterium]
MLREKVEKTLNLQVEKEGFSSNLYLAMASWTEVNGYPGSATWLYQQAEEERLHMIKIFRYINDRGGCGTVPAFKQPQIEFESLHDIFQKVFEHELFISQSINDLVGVCWEEKDYTTVQFLQWYVQEQIEEESNAKTILDRLNLLGEDKSRLYLFDRDIESFRKPAGAAPAAV